MKSMAEKSFEQLQVDLEKLEKMPSWYYTEEEKDEIRIIYNEAKYMINQTITLDDSNYIISFSLSVRGNTLTQEILNRRLK